MSDKQNQSIDNSTLSQGNGDSLPAALPQYGFSLLIVRRNGTVVGRPLLVLFSIDGKRDEVDVSGSELQSFGRFQAAVLERCGRWIDGDSFLGNHPRARKRDWQELVAYAVNGGEESA